MKIECQIGGHHYQTDLTAGHSIAITLAPDQVQPSHFGAPACTSQPLTGDGFIGDTRQGGSCNVNQLTLVPHCNGTHTESVAHIIDQMIPVHLAIEQSSFPTRLISLEPEIAANTDEDYSPGLDPENKVITRRQLVSLLDVFPNEQLAGLIIRTLPNFVSKKSAHYDQQNYPPYLTGDAMNYIVERQVQHLLVDFPSVDKMYDQGLLSNHRLFWSITPGERQLNENSQITKTITEMIYVKPDISDGFYLCNLQIPEIITDAVPSRPVIYPLTELT